MPTIKKKPKSKRKNKAKNGEPAVDEHPEVAETQPEATAVAANMEVEQKEIEVEKSFRVSSSLSLSFFGPVNFDAARPEYFCQSSQCMQRGAVGNQV